MNIGQTRAFGLAKETTVGTLVTTPDIYLPIMLPESFYPQIDNAEDDGIRGIPDVVYKVEQAGGKLDGMKAKFILEPENCGQLLKGLFGVDNVAGALSTGYTHTFTRLNAAQLPTYSVWVDKNPKYPQFAGCMVNKTDITIKPKSFIECDSDWTGLLYDDTGVSKSPTYSPLRGFKADQVAFSVDGSQSLNYTDLKLSFDNMVTADEGLNNSIWPAKIYSKGFKVTISAGMFVEDATQYNKFLSGTSCALNIAITSAQDITGANAGTKNSLIFDIPTAKYKSAPFPIQKGVLKINFVATALYTPGSTKTISAALKNSVSAAY